MKKYKKVVKNINTIFLLFKDIEKWKCGDFFYDCTFLWFNDRKRPWLSTKCVIPLDTLIKRITDLLYPKGLYP